MPISNSGPFRLSVIAAGDTPAVWRKINIGVGGSDSWGSSHACVERHGQGRIFHYFNGMNIYDPVANVWTLAVVRGRRENFGSDHDTDNGVIWMSPGAPAFDADPNSHTLKYSISSNSFSNHSSNGGGGDSVYAWDQSRKVLYGFGGFVIEHQPLVALNTISLGAWTPKDPSGAIPVLTNDSSKYTNQRGGIDSRNGKLWVIGDDEEFFQYDPNTNAWTRIATTGSKPPRFSVFMLDELHNCIVGHCGRSLIQGDHGEGTALNDTRILDLSTLQWTRGPQGAAVCPLPVAQVAYIPLYDRVRNRCLILLYNSLTGGTDVWQLVWK